MGPREILAPGPEIELPPVREARDVATASLTPGDPHTLSVRSQSTIVTHTPKVAEEIVRERVGVDGALERA